MFGNHFFTDVYISSLNSHVRPKCHFGESMNKIYLSSVCNVCIRDVIPTFVSSDFPTVRPPLRNQRRCSGQWLVWTASRAERSPGRVIGSERWSGYCARTSPLAKGTNMAEVRGKTGGKQSILNRYFYIFCDIFCVFTSSIEDILRFSIRVACFVQFLSVLFL